MLRTHETLYTSEDYWNLPEGERAELIDGKLYGMAPPNFRHQKLVSQLTRIIGNHIVESGGQCEVIPAPFAVNLTADDKKWVNLTLVSSVTGISCQNVAAKVRRISSSKSYRQEVGGWIMQLR